MTPTPVPTIELNVDWNSVFATTQAWFNVLFPITLIPIGIKFARKLMDTVRDSILGSF